MTLPEFKSIYWMEWAHRMWGRALGLAFVVPGAYFVLVKKTVTPAPGQEAGPPPGRRRRAGPGRVVDGAVGAVRADRAERAEGAARGAHEARGAPRVGDGDLLHARLHVAAAGVPDRSRCAPRRSAGAVAALRKVRMIAHPLAGVVAVTALSGAFVAGLDAGRAFNTFPKMNGRWVPEEYPGLRGAFSDTAAAQLHHRALAATTFVATWAAWAAGRSSGGLLPWPAAVLLAALPAAATLQASLGVATLLAYVPPGLGSAHQTGALGLLTLALGLVFATRRPPRVLATATKRALSGNASPLPAAGAAAAGAAAATAA